MGCRESKHAVATGNTLTKSRSSSANPEKNKQAEQNVPQMEANGNDTALLVPQETNDALSRDTGAAATVEDITERPELEQEEEIKEEETKALNEDQDEEKCVEEEKEIEPEQELEPETEPVLEEEEVEPGRFMSHDSPDHYFSPRRDKEALEEIMSEGLSSEYDSPQHEPVKEGEYRKVVVEEKNATALQKAEEMREKENDSAPDEEVVAHLATAEVAKSN
ncbi:hypothetical protein ACJRO7_020656 [Eucalyptus globulus]|uniref:Uncharacterized protein n=1 Tax=Eucalyptus globulus TaxID=34317 RepID=A0ABD3KK31_EUCGL